MPWVGIIALSIAAVLRAARREMMFYRFPLNDKEKCPQWVAVVGE